MTRELDRMNKIHHKLAAVALSAFVAFGGSAFARTGPELPPRGPVRTAIANPNTMNRVHDKGKICMNFTNYGYFGNDGNGASGALSDPCPPENWAPQCEYPCGSGVQYLFQGGLWIGALIVEEGFETKRVSNGLDGWFAGLNEMYPGEGDENGIIERSIRPGASDCFGNPISNENAVSDQDFIAIYSDTLTDQFYLDNDPVDGVHRPLGIKITQTSYSFSQAFAEDFILIDYEIENIASNFLKNLFIGLYVDADVGPAQGGNQEYSDDICGFLKNAVELNAEGDSLIIPVDVAWIADNDGRAPQSNSGPFTCPNVTGTRVIRAPNPRLRTSFNWWISNGDATLDYGPSWADHCDPDDPMNWTLRLGTPVGDEHKYQVLSNREFDFDQVMVDNLDDVEDQNDPDDSTIVHTWCRVDNPNNAGDIANGYDTRYLLSWGPLGIRDYQDQSGRWIYRLNPGEKFNMTLAYVAGENFHDANNPQPGNTDIDSSLFNFTDLRENARWSKDVYDNRMIDTPQHDWGSDGIPHTGDADHTEGDGILDAGDGWYGEDAGADGIYTDPPIGFRPGVDSVAVYYWKGTPTYGDQGFFVGYYHGPDEGERDGVIDQVNNIYLFPTTGGIGSEDIIMPEDLYYQHPRLRYWDMGWMSGNGRLDLGDGLPDFTGPPPPPIPALLHCVPNTRNASSHIAGVVRSSINGDCFIGGLGYELASEKVTIRWSKKASQSPEYIDPFSRVFDFEGYRVHRGTSRLDTSFSLIAQYDVIDFAYFSANDSMMTFPFVTNMPETVNVGQDTTIDGVVGHLGAVGENTGLGDITEDDSTFSIHIDAHTLSPLYYAVTAFDFGDPRAGLGPLATRPSANAVLLAPAGSDREPVRVVPNPYRAYEDYTRANLGVSWENQNDGTRDFYSQQDRRIEFINLPEKCLIRIFTVAGDLVQIVPHNMDGDRSQWASMTSERWDLNSRNRQQVVSGIYLFSVEDHSEGNGHQLETGKFVIIR